MIVLVFFCQTLVYREVTALFSIRKTSSSEVSERGKDPWSKTLNWYFFAVANYFLYGESIIYYFKVTAIISHPARKICSHALWTSTLYLWMRTSRLLRPSTG
jgi:hypothetical protein